MEHTHGLRRAQELAAQHCKLAADMVRVGRVLCLAAALLSALKPAPFLYRPAPPPPNLWLQIRCLPAAQSDHAEIAREALIQITHKVLTRKK
jgi:geranyl diphosphate synthase